MGVNNGLIWVTKAGLDVVGSRGRRVQGAEVEARSRGLCLSTSDWVDDLESTKERKRGKLRRARECGSLADLIEASE